MNDEYTQWIAEKSSFFAEKIRISWGGNFHLQNQ
jgi:hypothetical protein